MSDIQSDDLDLVGYLARKALDVYAQRLGYLRTHYQIFAHIDLDIYASISRHLRMPDSLIARAVQPQPTEALADTRVVSLWVPARSAKARSCARSL
jgi:hypothetical protein